MRTQKLLTAVLIGCAAATAAAQSPPPLPPAQGGGGGGEPPNVVKEVAPGPGPAKQTAPLPDPGQPEPRIHFDRVPGQPGKPEYRFLVEPQNREKGAFLGVAASPATPALREQLKLAKGMGLVVEFVEKGSPAEAAGLKQHDVITKLDDQRLVNAEQFAVLVRSHKPGDEIGLTIVRGGETSALRAKLIEKELAPVEDVYFYLRGMPGPQPHTEFFSIQPLEARRGGLTGPGMPGGGRPPGPPPRLEQGVSVSSTIVWTDGEHTLTITSNQSGRNAGEGAAPADTQPAERRALVAKDKDGAVLWEGPIDAPGAREKMPPVVAEKLKRMEAASKPARPVEQPTP